MDESTWFSKNISAPACRFMAVLPFPSQFSPREWRDLACVLEGKGGEVPKERRDALHVKIHGPAQPVEKPL